MATIYNVVSTTLISKEKLNLEEVAKKLENASYNPEKFNAMIIKINNPKATGLLFSSGRLVCTGTKSVHENKMAVYNIRWLIEKAGVNNTLALNHVVHNIVGSAYAGKNIDIISLAEKHKKFVYYEPELFPGARITFPDTRATALVFTSGKVVVTGLKSEAAVQSFYRKITCLLDMFLK